MWAVTDRITFEKLVGSAVGPGAMAGIITDGHLVISVVLSSALSGSGVGA